MLRWWLAPCSLLIVVDGMSIPVFLELQQSLKEHGWVQFERLRRGMLDAAGNAAIDNRGFQNFAVVGTACAGSAATERSAFSAYPSLVAPSVAGKPPVIFISGICSISTGVILSG